MRSAVGVIAIAIDLMIEICMDDGLVQRGVLEAGGNFLEKPFNPVSLVLKVREVLDHV